MGNFTWKEALAILLVISAGGVLTYTDLLGVVLNLKQVSYVSSGDGFFGENVEAYVNVTTKYWSICFEHNNQEMMPLFKKRTRSRTLWVNLNNFTNIFSTAPEIPVQWLVPARGAGNWRPIKDGDCWRRDRVNRIKFVGKKPLNQDVKWSFLLGDFIDIDPVWIGRESGYVIKDDDTYWEIADNLRITVSPHTARSPQGKSKTQYVNLTNIQRKQNDLICAYSFKDDPKYFQVSNWKDGSYTEEYIEETITTINYSVINNDTGKMEIVFEDVSSFENKVRRMNGFHWEPLPNSFDRQIISLESGEIKSFKVDYIPADTDRVSARTGKRKWGITCNGDDFNLTLDPFSQDVADYLFFDTGDKNNFSVAGEDGGPVNWSVPGNVIYNTSADQKLGTTAIHRIAGGTQACIDIPDQNNITFQCAMFDDFDNASQSRYFTFGSGCASPAAAQYGIGVGASLTNYTHFSSGGVQTGPGRSRGFHNFTIFFEDTTNIIYFLDGNEFDNEPTRNGRGMGALETVFTLGGFLDDCFVWKGNISQRPLAPIINVPPTIESIVFNQSSYNTNEDIGIDVNISDDEGDSFTVNVTWENGITFLYSELRTDVIQGIIFNFTLGSANFSKNDVINVTVNASDGTDFNSSFNFTTIVNSLPTIAFVNLTADDSPLNTTLANLTCDVNCSDPDIPIDTCLAVNRTFWWNNTILVPSLENETVIGFGNTTVGEEWICGWQAGDGENISEIVNSTPIIINAVETKVNLSLQGVQNNLDVELGSVVNVTGNVTPDTQLVCLSAEHPDIGDNFTCGIGTVSFLWNSTGGTRRFNGTFLNLSILFTSSDLSDTFFLENIRNHTRILSSLLVLNSLQSVGDQQVIAENVSEITQCINFPNAVDGDASTFAQVNPDFTSSTLPSLCAYTVNFTQPANVSDLNFSITISGTGISGYDVIFRDNLSNWLPLGSGGESGVGSLRTTQYVIPDNGTARDPIQIQIFGRLALRIFQNSLQSPSVGFDNTSDANRLHSFGCTNLTNASDGDFDTFAFSPQNEDTFPFVSGQQRELSCFIRYNFSKPENVELTGMIVSGRYVPTPNTTLLELEFEREDLPAGTFQSFFSSSTTNGSFTIRINDTTTITENPTVLLARFEGRLFNLNFTPIYDLPEDLTFNFDADSTIEAKFPGEIEGNIATQRKFNDSSKTKTLIYTSGGTQKLFMELARTINVTSAHIRINSTQNDLVTDDEFILLSPNLAVLPGVAFNNFTNRLVFWGSKCHNVSTDTSSCGGEGVSGWQAGDWEIGTSFVGIVEDNAPDYGQYTCVSFKFNASSSDRGVYVIGGVPASSIVSALRENFFMADNGTQTAKTKIPIAAHNSPCVTHQGSIYVIGNGSTQIFNTSTETWSSGTPPETIAQANALEIFNNTHLLFWGGEQLFGIARLAIGPADFNTTALYNIEEDSWQNLSSAADYLVTLHSSAKIDGVIYSYGGFDGTGIPTNVIRRFTGSSWETLVNVTTDASSFRGAQCADANGRSACIAFHPTGIQGRIAAHAFYHIPFDSSLRVGDFNQTTFFQEDGFTSQTPQSFEFTDAVNEFLNDPNQCATNLTTCLLDFNFFNLRIGNLNIQGINVTYPAIEVNFGGFNVSCATQECNITVRVNSTSAGLLNLFNLSVTWLGKSINAWTASTETSGDFSGSNVTYNTTLFYSNWNFTFPRNIDFLEFIPTTPTSDNVGAFGQTFDRPIINVTNLNFDGKNATFSMRINQTDSCVNLTFGTDGNASNATQFELDLFQNFSFNNSPNSQFGIWLFADYDCNLTFWDLWEPEIAARSCCNSCYCDESVI